MPPKRRNEEQITEKDIKKGRKRNKFFNLQIEQLENKEELLYVLKSYELNPISIISKDDVIEVEYRKDQDPLSLLSEIHENENYNISGTNSLRTFKANYSLRKITLHFNDSVDMKSISKFQENLKNVEIIRHNNKLVIRCESDVKIIVDNALRLMSELCVKSFVNSKLSIVNSMKHLENELNCLLIKTEK